MMMPYYDRISPQETINKIRALFIRGYRAQAYSCTCLKQTWLNKLWLLCCMLACRKMTGSTSS